MTKIHIIGSIGSGKTTVARWLAKELAIPHYELDNVVWQRSAAGDVRRSVEQRDDKLATILSQGEWIIEGVHYKWLEPSFQAADIILYLDTPYKKRRARIIKRFIKQKLGLEKSNYKPSFRIVKMLYQYNKHFDYEERDNIFKTLKPFHSKVVIYRDSKDVLNKESDFLKLFK